MSTLIGQRFTYQGLPVTISSTKYNGNTIFLKNSLGQEIEVNKKDLYKNSLFSNPIGENVKKYIENMQKENDKYINEQGEKFKFAEEAYNYAQYQMKKFKNEMQKILQNNNTESEKFLCSNDKTKYGEFYKLFKQNKDLCRSYFFDMFCALGNKFDACLWGFKLNNQEMVANAC